jgi:hypothetical protein
METTSSASRFASPALLGSRMPTGISVDLTRSPLDRQRALELQRDVYRRKGLLLQNTLRPQVLPQACAPGSAMFVVKEHDSIVGTITFYMDSVIGLPMDDVHRAEVDRMRNRFARVAEVGGLAALTDRRGLEVTMMLFQAIYRWAVATNAQCIVACVNPSSRRVYSKGLLFEVLGQCKEHPRFRGAPSIPIGLDLTGAPTRFMVASDRKPHRHLDRWMCDTHQLYTFAATDSAQYLQWSNDEVSEMIETKQLSLAGDHQLYVERHYSASGMASSPR